MRTAPSDGIARPRIQCHRHRGGWFPAAIELALHGEGPGSQSALKLCVQRLVPVPQDRPIPLALPAKPTADDLIAAHNALVKSLAAGELTPREAEAVSNVLEASRRTWESTNLSTQLNQIEDRLNRPLPKIEWKGKY